MVGTTPLKSAVLRQAAPVKANVLRALGALGAKLVDPLYEEVKRAIRESKALKLAKADDNSDTQGDLFGDKKPGLQPDGSIITQMGTVITASSVQTILEAIKDEDFSVLEATLTPDIVEAFKQAGYTVVQEVQTLSREPHDILEVLDKDAVAYADERGAELVTQLADSTRDKVRGTVVDALTEGWSKQEFSAELQANYAFSPQRADMIAHTELAFAHSYGRVEPMKAAGATKKKWLLSADHDPDEDCLCSEAADAGWIDIDDNFADDDDYDYPPGHPNCWCDWVSNLAGGDEEDDDGGNDTGGGDSGGESEDAGKLQGVGARAPDINELHKQLRDVHARLARLKQRRDPDGIESEEDGTGTAGNVEGAALRARLEELAEYLDAPTSDAEKAAWILDLSKYSEDQPRDEDGRFGSGASLPPMTVKTKGGGERQYNLKFPSGAEGGMNVASDGMVRSAYLPPEARGAGLGRAMYRAVQAHLDRKGGVLLHSGIDTSESAQRMWQGLVSEGAAEQTGKHSWQMLPTATRKYAGAALTKYPVDGPAYDAATGLHHDLEDRPTPAQIKAGNYRMGHIEVGGLPISIENMAGTPRKAGWVPIKGHYGYFKRTEGADGDHVDVFVKPGIDSSWTGDVYVVDQFRLNGTFDEHKVLVGYDNKEEAVAAYLGSYQEGWKLGPVNTMPWELFVRWLKTGDTSVPISTNLEFFQPPPTLSDKK